jgi:hypothetical protein
VLTPWVRSQSLRVLSQEPERAKWPSDDITASLTKWLWPFNRFWGMPKFVSSWTNFHNITEQSEDKEWKNHRLMHQVTTMVTTEVMLWGNAVSNPRDGNHMVRTHSLFLSVLFQIKSTKTIHGRQIYSTPWRLHSLNKVFQTNKQTNKRILSLQTKYSRHSVSTTCVDLNTEYENRNLNK